MNRFTLELPAVKPPARTSADAAHAGRLLDPPDTWRFLREALLPQLLAAKEGGPLRVWSAGRSAGEDAYSVVLLLAELIGPAAIADRVRIFATDSQDTLLARFQRGECPADALSHVPEEHRREYLDRVDGHFALRPMLRDAIFFGEHSLVTDAPLGQVDLLLCRKALSDLTPSSAGLTIRRLAYALGSNGYLVAGQRDDALVTHSGLFEAVEPTSGVYRKVGSSRLRSLMPLAALCPKAKPQGGHVAQAPLPGEAGCGHLLLDGSGVLIMTDDTARQLLEVPSGARGDSTVNLAWSGQPEDFTRALQTALTSGRPGVLEDLELQTCSGETSRFDVEIVPTRAPEGRPAGAVVRLSRPGWRRVVAFRTREAWQSLQVALETVRASEEELRAAYEELEAANEQLQALNNRLADANAALVAEQRSLSRRCEEIGAALHAIPHAILATTSAGTIVACSAAAAASFGWPADSMIGQPLSNFIEAAARARPDTPVGIEQVCASGSLIGRRRDGVSFTTAVQLFRSKVGSTTLFVLSFGEVAQDQDAGHSGRRDGPEPTGRLAALTPREREVMRLLVRGQQSKEIAHQLGISRRTVDVHRGRLMRKMHARSIADLIRRALADGLIERY